MADMIRVEPGNLRDAAAHHGEAAEYLRTVPSSHDAIQESLDSLGPIFGDLREAGRELLEQRRLCYEQQAQDHATMADNLRRSADYWEQHETDTALEMRGVLGENQ
jgi:hypothetical protein